jgi:hypothetical protein
MRVDLIQIGDYFAYPTQTVHDGKWKIGRVNFTRHDGIVQVDFADTKAELLEPIELTLSILENNGFKKCIVTNGGGIDKNMNPYRITERLYVDNGLCGTLVCCSNGGIALDVLFECKYVHQLQHILKDSGVLKEIEL